MANSIAASEAAKELDQEKFGDRKPGELEKLMEECKDFDYLRFSTISISGEVYVKAVPKRHVPRFLKNGSVFWEGLPALGTACDLYHDIFEIVGVSNLPLRPMPETVHPLPWAANGKFKVGNVICEPLTWAGEHVKEDPRYVCRQQIKRLNERGLSIKSGSEMEFMLYTKDMQPIGGNKCLYATATGHAEREEFMYEVDTYMYQAGIDIENLLEEYSQGQQEYVLAPALDVDGADQVMKFKQSARELAQRKNMIASFMSMPFDGVGNGMHFNHSIVDTNTGRNAFYNASLPENLSEFARHWLAGLLFHANALTALCSATVNCYRRIGAAWAPGKPNWGIDDRLAMIRVKNTSESGTYMEQRIPGGAANPYVVMAATIAAGLDGVEKKMACPPAVEFEKCEELLPQTPKDGMDALKENKVMIEALGQKFIEFLIFEKERSQMVAFPDWKWENKDEEQFAKERETYFKYV